ncbi:MAG: thiamine pyrophosphate-dependent enzyme [Methanolinea sp.]|jgi:2-oxoglutarate ferredoxin oxidoreductase subunit beta|nr:thiamine pyrophosphate-dependent enzyme [Methanolinea sp.]
MTGRNLVTGAQNTWCPGCGNFVIQFALKNIIQALEKEGVNLDRIVLVTGIGCHAKMADYLNINSFYSIHGRTLPVATAMKMANPDLVVLVCAGDGDCYAEGLDHLIFAAKRNTDITLIVHNNRVYGLTTGQYTPTSPLGFKGRSTPGGTVEEPFNPLEIMLASGATYVARGCTRRMDLLQKTIMDGIHHPGFAFIDVLQVCASYFNLSEYYDARVYEIKDHDEGDFEAACRKAREWDYNEDAPVGLGTMYRTIRPTLEKRFSAARGNEKDRSATIRKVLEKRA